MPHDTPAAIHAKQEKEQQLNGPLMYAPDQALQAPPSYKIYIYNLLPLQWPVAKGSAGNFTILACEPGEPYSEPLILPSVCIDSYFVESEMKTHSVTGEFMAQDIVHPTIGANWSFGQNLDELGCFWTRNNPPTEKEISAARTKMEATGRKILAMATSIETSGNLNDITPLMRIFATYWGEDRAWNRIYKKLSACPGCGESCKEGIIKHHCGYIFDPDRALLAGMISTEQHKAIMGLRGQAERPQEVERKAGGRPARIAK
jgi:hypothetical protein